MMASILCKHLGSFPAASPKTPRDREILLFASFMLLSYQ